MCFLQWKEKHHPLKCPLLGDLGLKIIKVGGGKKGGSSLGSGGSGAVNLGGSTPLSSTPPAAAPAAVSPPPAASDLGSASAPAGLMAAVEPEDVGDEDSADDFRWYGDDDGPTINLMGPLLRISRHVPESRSSLSLLGLPRLGLSSVAFLWTPRFQVTTSSSLRNWSPLSSGLSPLLIHIALSWLTRAQRTICFLTVWPLSPTSLFNLFGSGWATTHMLPSLGGARPLSH